MVKTVLQKVHMARFVYAAHMLHLLVCWKPAWSQLCCSCNSVAFVMQSSKLGVGMFTIVICL